MILKQTTFRVLNPNRSQCFTSLCIKRMSSQQKDSSLQVLGLSEGASKKEVKEAYLKLSKEFHPDINKDLNATVRYQQIRDAYDHLQLEGFTSIRTEARESNEFKENRSKEYSQWKVRTEKKKGLDDWLKKAERNAREQKLKMKAMEENESIRRRNSFYENDTNDQVVDVKLDSDYLNFEKKFIARLDFFLNKLRGSKTSEKDIVEEMEKNNKRPRAVGGKDSFLAMARWFFPWYGRWILTRAPLVMVGVAATLLGLEVYSSQTSEDFDRCNEPPVGRKSGTLDDL
eukprot:GFUD01019361.1.p1 GENE.GFUD01019361.1~~GFUD01019361.1.p1  ORF type:complete len:286 (-),score=52.66 GFUD01019361.1:75-932(-)